MTQSPTSITDYLPYIGLSGALGAALAAFIQARKAHQANAAQIFLSFSERYNSPAMAEAMRSLVHWRFENGDAFAEAWEKRRQAGEVDASTINCYRRLVSRFYFDVARLSEIGLINSRLARAILANNGLHVFYQVCEPMNDARHPDRDRRLSTHLKGLRQTYGSNRLHRHGGETIEARPIPWWAR